MAGHWTLTDTDAAMAEELAAWLPDRVFDVHAHLYRLADLKLHAASFVNEGPEEVGLDVWRERTGRQVGPTRLAGGLFIPFPTAGGDPDAANRYVLDRIEGQPNAAGLVLVSPTSDRAKTEELCRRPNVVGFKPYHCFSPEKNTFASSLSSFVPDWVWQLADTHGLVIMLHLVRARALLDPGNQREVRTLCERYPRARLVLAHAARGFHAPNTVRGIASLAGLETVWFDSSAVCEPEPLAAILDAVGPRRLLWGSDFPVSQQRGRCVTVGEDFAWISPERIDTYQDAPPCRAALVGLESLRALRSATDLLSLSAEDLRDIFHDNAQRLLGRDEAEGDRTQGLYEHARERIPGGTQLLSKRPELYAPGQWPAYFREARGCEVWDLDGRHYYDMSTNGIGACLLGYRDPEVTRAVLRRVRLGSMSTLNPPEEVALADLLCELHPWAERVRLARTGGEAMAVAVRIARATTDRSMVAICGYHGWHDWYLSANLGADDSLRGHLLPGLDPKGVPAELRGTACTFTYNDREALRAILDQHGSRLAAVVMEPCRYRLPEPGFLEFARDAAHRAGAVLIFDEVSIGWRLAVGGAHLKLGVSPDIAVFAKALGNGHPIAAVIGTACAMEGAHESFISSTYWTESVGPTAAVAAVRRFMQADVPAHIASVGERVQGVWRECGAAHGLPVVVDDAWPALAHFKFDHEQGDALRTLYTQLMIERGYLAGTAIYPTLAHTDAVVERYGAAIDEVFGLMAEVVESGEVRSRLKGPVAHSGFRRLL